MTSITNYELKFHNTTFHPIDDGSKIWLTSTELAKALEYADAKSITKIYARNQDEFTPAMSMVVNVTTNGINNSLRTKKVRVFSIRGAHLVGMFAETPVAKEFRRWVLDILDREVATGAVPVAFNFELYAHNAGVVKRHMDIIYKEWCEKLSPSLRALGSPIAAELAERIKSSLAITDALSSALEQASTNGKRIH
ncbi:BRO-N domain-containing protein [Winslowiella toletana]|uniref:BRO-N domain-containing protein n=1 Tax=Winslowiella toletana TaxID=92490 RepID=UPI0028BDC5B4|nr:BRO family protein [Winslowiella toletana]WNN42778.1 BRO family protein [Winslowiella toletana]